VLWAVRALTEEEMAASASVEQINRAFEEYSKIGGFMDDGIK
jgi:hypothetical protein